MLIAVGFAYVPLGRGGDVISQAAGSGVRTREPTRQDKAVPGHEQGKVVPPGIADRSAQSAGP